MSSFHVGSSFYCFGFADVGLLFLRELGRKDFYDLLDFLPFLDFPLGIGIPVFKLFLN